MKEFVINRKKVVSFIIALIIGIMAFFFEGSSELDLSRYYENAKSIDTNQDIINFVKITFKNNFDFIYFLSFLIVNKIGLSVNFVNFFYVFLFYFYTLLIIDYLFKNVNYHTVNLIKLYTILSAPILILFSISRNLAALSFFYIAIYMYLRKKKKYWLFIVISIFTHVGMLIFFTLTAVSIILNRLNIFKINRLNFLLFSILFFFLGSGLSFLSLNGGFIFQDGYSRYGDYIEKTGFNFNYFGPVEIIYYFLIVIINFYIILKSVMHLNKTILYLFIGVFFFQLFTINYSVMFFQRSLMFNVLFSGYLFGENILRAKFAKNHTISVELHKLLVVVLVTIFLAYLYSYRGHF